jgi:hypothetical protein
MCQLEMRLHQHRQIFNHQQRSKLFEYMKKFEGKAHARFETLVKIDQSLVMFMESNIVWSQILSSIDRLSVDVKE